jgi:hypothetical protein
MRKGETLEQEAARKKAEAELPKRIKGCTDRVDGLIASVKHSIVCMKASRKSNEGGEKSGKIPQL